MATIPTPEDDPIAWDTLILGGVKLPGIVVCDASTKRDYDVQKAKGKTKAAIKNNGDPPRKIKFEWMIDMDRDWGAAQDAMATIDPRKENKTLQPLEVIHPIAAFYGLHTALVEELSGPKIEHRLGTFSLSLIEREKPKPAAGVGGSAKGVASAPSEQQYAYLQHKLLEIDAQLAQLNAIQTTDPQVAAQIDAQLRQLKAQREEVLAAMKKPSQKGVNQNT